MNFGGGYQPPAGVHLAALLQLLAGGNHVTSPVVDFADQAPQILNAGQVAAGHQLPVYLGERTPNMLPPGMRPGGPVTVHLAAPVRPQAAPVGAGRLIPYLHQFFL